MPTAESLSPPVAGHLLHGLMALRQGDFSHRLPSDLTGIEGKLADTFNEVVAMNQRMAQELERISHAVGRQGRLSQRATLGDVRGSWAASVDSVNTLIDDLVHPTTEMARVIGAVAKGDLSQTMALETEGRPLEGEFRRTAITVNTMVDQLGSFASEVTRVAREVGTEGKLAGQAQVRGVAGTWKDLTDNVNLMAGNLTAQVRNIAEVTTAVANGDLTKKIAVDVKGEFLELKNTINTMVDQLRSFASEVTRVAREVGTEGKLGGQARVEGVSGTWKDLTDSVNSMAGNLTSQVRNIAAVTTAVARGDLSKQITVDVQGEMLELKNTVNTMVDQLSSFAAEVTRVAREVGSEGKLGGQAQVQGVSGTWKDLTDSVNSMAGNLTGQVRNIAAVTTAVARGDLTKKITVDVQGEILELKNTVNTMVDQLSSFAAEVTRVAREVGTEGKLGGQAEVPGVDGTWKDLTDNVNLMASNLTVQLRDVSKVATAIATGDLTQKVTVDVRGEILQIKNVTNTMVDQLRSFASEVTRVAREVGTEGKLGGQARVEGVSGTWKDLTDSVNSMAGNLTSQVRNIAAVTTAVARGDLSKQITVDVQGEILELKNTVNTMVDQLSSFAAEVTRVAREVGSEGKLGGQADVRGVAGTWKDLTDSVNFMAGNLTSQVRNIAEVTTAVAKGDLTKKITVDVQGEILELKNTVNTMVDQLSSFAAEVTRVAREVGTEGKLGGQAEVPGVAGTWKDLTDNVNLMASNLTVQLRDVSKVATAIATGDLTQKVTVDVRGEILQIKNVINTMVDQLRSFASEVTRVAREVGSEGKLGGQARVEGVSGTWRDLTDNVNSMAGNLTSQVRGIARVVTAVANGDLTRKLTVEAEGEIAALSDTINSMIDTLATFADQTTSVAFEVGVEGKLGGQASVPGAAGTWKDLTDNVNRLAANLTTQVRAIAEVATAVTTGDLTRSIQVEAQGEVAALKDNINYMIGNLKDTTLKNAEQDWLKTNLAKFSRMLQGQRDLLTVGRLVLSELAPVVSAQQGVLYVLDTSEQDGILRLLAGYAHKTQAAFGQTLHLGEGLIGQCAMDRRKIQLDGVSAEYLKVVSGLGEATPRHLVILPILFEGQVKGVLELASFDQFNPAHHAFLDQLTETIGIVLHTIEANTRTEDLLKQSQSLAHELQFQQQELQLTNQQLEEKAKLLAEQNVEVERKNTEVEQARQALEEKAKQLALTSRFKSEFLANMSHELRTPLNSLLILSDQLSKNPAGNLTGKQVQFAQTIHASGNDLLTLINDILDLSKIESGTVAVDIEDYSLEQLRRYVDRTFRHVAEAQRLEFSIDIEPRLHKTFETDPKRLQQVLKNLLSNAFKFTAHGSVQLSIRSTRGGWSQGNDALDRARSVLAISVRDTGIGIPPEKQLIIFEAFQQADGSTSRKYGGTGLGLAISRELARLLGGELTLVSTPDQGSTFTLYLPQSYAKTRTRKSSTEAVEPVASQVAPTSADEPVEALRALSAPLVDDRDMVGPQDRVLLVVDNDQAFSGVMADLAHDHGYKVLTTAFGAAALALARERQPDAITLDISLPDFDGWRVLDRLKHDLDTRHIPVFVITTDEERERSFSLGAAGVLNKPVQTREQLEVVFETLARVTRPEPPRALVVGAAEVAGDLRRLFGESAVALEAIDSWDQAQMRLSEGIFDCLVINAADAKHAFAALPPESPAALVVYAPSGVDPETSRDLRRQTLVRPVRLSHSAERLFDDVALLLHVRPQQMQAEARETLDRRYRSDAMLAGRKVLIVDDDIRNIFAMTSVLETHHMQVVAAENGKDGIQKLRGTPGIDIVLMDIMMPDMDGYDTMRAIRGIPAFRSLPIVAVTAKAMKGDREKCIEAGAWDYLPKPVASDQLLAVFRTWLHR